MQAIVVHKTGGPEVLQYEKVLRPTPLVGEVLIKVCAAGVNPAEVHVRSGFVSLPETLRPPINLPYTPGSDVAGLITEVGPGTTEFKINDEVFGLINFPPVPGKRSGKTYAEYTIAKVSDLTLKPVVLSCVEAAAIPMAALTAWQQLCVNVPVQPMQTVMIRGAAGGVGHFAVQFAKYRGSRVIAVASAKHKSFLLALGADEFFDYAETNLFKNLREVELLFDCVGGSDSAQIYAAIKPGGTVVTLMPTLMIPQEQRDELLKQYNIKLIGTLVHSSGIQLAEISKLFEKKIFKVKIDSTFPLSDAQKAHEHIEIGHVQGKIVLKISGSTE
jgi:NADPH:quinone reductase-like Zn-dependent oxidoreductase